MDFSKFSAPDFDIKDWVNTSLESEQNTNALIMKLQLIMQEVNTSLESTTTSLINDIPRVVSEVNALYNESQLLKNQMSIIKSDINKVVKDTSDSVSTVVKLDKVKHKMHCTIQKLKQADNWSLLNDEIDQLFEDQEDLVALSEKLSVMRDSLAALTNLPDYEERSERFNNLSNKLEAIISPKLIAALNSHDKIAVRTYYDIFTDLNREDEFFNYYYRTHRTNVNRILGSVEQGGEVDSWLPQVYERIFDVYMDERQWCRDIFPNYEVITVTLLTQSLVNTDISHDVNNFIADSDVPFDAIVALAAILNKFLHRVNKEISSDLEGYDPLVSAVVAPYIKHFLTYGDKLKTSLLRYINTLSTRVRRTSVDTVREVESSCKKLTNRVYDTVATCLQLTNGNALSDVITVLEFYFGLFIEKLSSLIKEMRNSYCTAGKEDMIPEDHWIRFQSCFKLLQTLGNLYNEIKNMEEQSLADIRSFTLTPTTFTTYTWRSCDQGTSDMVEEVKNGEKTVLFDRIFKEILVPLNECNKLCVEIVLCNVKKYLHGVHLSEEWVKKEGPVFTPSPLTYITTLGDYLLLLPQQLEPFVAEQHQSCDLDTALSLVDFNEFAGMNEDMEGDAFAWLTCVCQSTLFTLVETILRIPRLSEVGCRQLGADVSYLSNVMAALEVPLSRDVIDIGLLLSLPIDRCNSDETKHIPKYLCNKIIVMRNAGL